jgi:hypothetical protein
MSYRPLADSPEEHIALRARRISHEDDTGFDAERELDDEDGDVPAGLAEDLDLCVQHAHDCCFHTYGSMQGPNHSLWINMHPKSHSNSRCEPSWLAACWVA